MVVTEAKRLDLSPQAIGRDDPAPRVERVHWWERYAEREKGSIDNSPTPGNKAGGRRSLRNPWAQ